MVEVEGGDARARLDAQVIVAGVQSIGRPTTKRLEGFQPGLMILDEAHHAAPASGNRYGIETKFTRRFFGAL